MNMFKKLSFALIFAVAAVFTAAAATECKSCPDAKEVKACPVAEKCSELKKAGYVMDEKSSDDIFQWWVKGASRKLIYVGKLKVDGKVKFVPTTIYTFTVPYDGVCNPGRQIMMYHPEGYSKGTLVAKASLKLLKNDKNEFIVGANVKDAGILQPGDWVADFEAIELVQSAVAGGEAAGQKLSGWGGTFVSLWHSTGIYDIIRQSSSDFKATWTLGIGRVLMILVALVLIYLAIAKEFEPLLLLPIGFGAMLANIPLAGISGPDGLQGMIFEIGINSGVFPLLIFLGVGAMTDFAPLIANPKTALLGGAAQFGIFSALLGALALGAIGIDFDLKDAASIGIIGGADGPTAIYLASRLSPKLLGTIAVAAYSYMALVPIIQPPIMRLLTTEAERKIRMTTLRPVSKIEKICFPILITLLCALLLPDAAPLIGMLMFGNLLKESGVTERLNQTAQNALINIVTIFLGIAVGSKLSADQFLSEQTLGILFLGAVAFSIGTAAGLLFAKLMNLFCKTKINPLIGSAGVSAVPMAARVANKVGQESDPHNFLLMHAMGPNVAGVIGSAVAAGVLLNMLKNL